MIDKFFHMSRTSLLLISCTGLIIFGYICWFYVYPDVAKVKNIAMNPEKHPGTTVCLNFCPITDKNANEVISSYPGKASYFFLMDTSLVEINKVYSFRGMITPEGKIRVINFQHHPHRNLKYLLSLLSLPVILFLVVKYIGFDKKSFSFIIKNW